MAALGRVANLCRGCLHCGGHPDGAMAGRVCDCRLDILAGCQPLLEDRHHSSHRQPQSSRSSRSLPPVPFCRLMRHAGGSIRRAACCFRCWKHSTPVVRPVRVKYDPLSVVSPAELPPLFSLSAVPGQRRSRQPLRVVLERALSAPGRRVRARRQGLGRGWNGSRRLAGTADRPRGAAARDMAVVADSREASHSTASGCRSMPSSSDFARRDRLSGRSLNCISERWRSSTGHRRFESPTVRSSADFGRVTRVLSTMGMPFPEAEGLLGKRPLTPRSHDSETERKIRRHCRSRFTAEGGQTPRSLATRDWSERIELVPGVYEQDCDSIDRRRSVRPLSVTSSDGFIPAEVEARSKDRRLLGVWIAFIPDDTAKTSEGR